MWSLGVVLLEFLTGIPIWMSYKCRPVSHNSNQPPTTGIFAVQGRDAHKILQKQQFVLQNLTLALKKYECYGIDEDVIFMDLLNQMLENDPLKRISPIEVLEHPFLLQTKQ